jgi:putative flippase GtrA
MVREIPDLRYRIDADVQAEAEMTGFSPYQRVRTGLLAAWRNRAVGLKAIVFGLVGLVNTAVDYGLFLLARAALDRSPAALSAFGSLADVCRCGSTATLSLIAANAMSWIVAISGSYIMNSSITFAHETGRKLTWRAYATFVVSGIAGWLANTAALLFAAQVLQLPVWLAKVCAILASFVVNFSLSHFVVFRVRGAPSGTTIDQA